MVTPARLLCSLVFDATVLAHPETPFFYCEIQISSKNTAMVPPRYPTYLHATCPSGMRPGQTLFCEYDEQGTRTQFTVD